MTAMSGPRGLPRAARLLFLFGLVLPLQAGPVEQHKRQFTLAPDDPGFQKTTVYTTETPTPLPTDVTSFTHTLTVGPARGSQLPSVGNPLWNLTTLDVDKEGPLTLEITLNGGNASSPVLYGIMIEDIDHCVDGGLYAELVQNRAFQNNTLDYWYPVGGATISLNYDNPISYALESNLQVNMTQSGYGFENIGWWGFYVTTQPYRASFWARTTKSTSFTVKASLQSAADGTEYGSAQFELNSTSWTYYEAYIQPSRAAPNNNNVYVITSECEESDSIEFQLISLFPPTYNNRPNGVRVDLMQDLVNLDLRYCRVPGGNNLEGVSIPDRWIWNNTIGPLIDRPGRLGTWGYFNTDGMGLLEWAEFCEDLEAEFLLGIWAGYALNRASVPEDGLQPYIDSVIAEIEYLIGDASSTYGALRVRDGHPEPFALKQVEIGNEDFFSSTYYYRWPPFYAQLHAAYPQLQFVATTDLGITLPVGVLWDQHQYGDPHQFEGLFSAYDNFPRNNGTIPFVGEYSVQRYDNETFAPYPFVEGSVAEAVYGIGLERNSDLVLTQLYAPFFSNLHWNPEGKPRLISFDVNPADTVFSTSYHALQLLSTTHGVNSEILPVEASIGFHPLYWVASNDLDTGTIYAKIANAGPNNEAVNIGGNGCCLQGFNASVMSGPQNASNTPADPTLVQIVDLPFQILANGSMHFTMPAWSVVVASLREGGSCENANVSSSTTQQRSHEPTGHSSWGATVSSYKHAHTTGHRSHATSASSYASHTYSARPTSSGGYASHASSTHASSSGGAWGSHGNSTA